jgi:uncharacterized protein with PQ loop repeat
MNTYCDSGAQLKLLLTLQTTLAYLKTLYPQLIYTHLHKNTCSRISMQALGNKHTAFYYFLYGLNIRISNRCKKNQVG